MFDFTENDKKFLNDIKKINKLMNEFRKKFNDTIDPRDYIDNNNSFICLAITGPTVFLVDIINRICQMYDINTDEFLKTVFKMIEVELARQKNDNDSKKTSCTM